MPWENIGECGAADLSERERMIAEVKLGAQYVKLICGQPPQGCKVDAMWHEHDLGEYATVGLFWDPLQISDAPWDYISRAEDVLSCFDDSVEWSLLSERDEDEQDEDAEDEEEKAGEASGV
jgi:hypothetical protein